MHGQWRLGIILCLLLSLIVAVPAFAFAQEGEPTCADEANGEPAVQVSQEGRSDFVVTGCNFAAGEAVTISARLKQGDGDWVQLDAIQAQADAEGAFGATFAGPERGLDFASGYQIEVTTEGANGSSAGTGMAAIAGSRMPPRNLPETGGGGTSGPPARSPLVFAALLPVLVLTGLSLRRLARLRQRGLQYTEAFPSDQHR